MPTGACGINCDYCRLHISGICSTCGSPKSEAGRAKLAVQRKNFGACCPILGCCEERNIDNCLRDCDDYPCETLTSDPYPFSKGFVDMQSRRRKEIREYPDSAWTSMALELWSNLESLPGEDVCVRSGATLLDNGNYQINCLSEKWEIHVSEKRILKVTGDFGGEWDRQIPFLLLFYLVRAGESQLSEKMVAPREIIGGGNFFQGIYTLATNELESAFGRDINSFQKISEKLGGIKANNADISMRFSIFPKLAAEYMLWLEDEEFPGRVNILLAENSAEHYPPDTMAMVINLLSGRLLFASQLK